MAAPLFEQKPGVALNRLYDRNACSSAQAQEVVQVLATWPGGMQLVRTRYEEQTLRAEFPEYAGYAARTRRLIPGVY